MIGVILAGDEIGGDSAHAGRGLGVREVHLLISGENQDLLCLTSNAHFADRCM